MDLKGSVFVVTGGGSGLGAATAQMVVEAGGSVVLADVNVDAGEARLLLLGHHRPVAAEPGDQ
nr:SDR family NAD(P)-dependent oxidoreductase [Denitromonas sp.]